jgi:ubiquinone/menaquinone biosynthesis C-methylase UbiE
MDNLDIPNKEIYEQTLPDGKLLGKIGPRDLKRFEDTAKYIRHDVESLLDVGCFCGEWLHYVLEHRPSIRKHLGTDIARNKIDEAKQLLPGLNVIVSAAEELDLPEKSFDVVTCLEVLEHIPGWLKVFHSLFRFARKQVIITVPYREEIQYTACVHCAKLTPIWGHLRSYSEESFPEVAGWSLSFEKIRDRDPNAILIRKAYHFFKPHYPWLLVNYQSIS